MLTSLAFTRTSNCSSSIMHGVAGVMPGSSLIRVSTSMLLRHHQPAERGASGLHKPVAACHISSTILLQEGLISNATAQWILFPLYVSALQSPQLSPHPAVMMMMSKTVHQVRLPLPAAYDNSVALAFNPIHLPAAESASLFRVYTAPTDRCTAASKSPG